MVRSQIEYRTNLILRDLILQFYGEKDRKFIPLGLQIGKPQRWGLKELVFVPILKNINIIWWKGCSSQQNLKDWSITSFAVTLLFSGVLFRRHRVAAKYLLMHTCTGFAMVSSLEGRMLLSLGWLNTVVSLAPAISHCFVHELKWIIQESLWQENLHGKYSAMFLIMFLPIKKFSPRANNKFVLFLAIDRNVSHFMSFLAQTKQQKLHKKYLHTVVLKVPVLALFCLGRPLTSSLLDIPTYKNIHKNFNRMIFKEMKEYSSLTDNSVIH